MAMRSRRNGMWRRPVVVARAGRHPYDPLPDVATNARGDAIIVWGRTTGEDRRLRVTYRPLGHSWTPVRRLTDAGTRPRLYAVAVGGCGEAAVAWLEGKRTLQVRRIMPSG